MAIQCATCGTQTRAGAKFCHACGTPIATTSLPPTLPLPPEARPEPTPVITPTAPQGATATEPIRVSTMYAPPTPPTYQVPLPIAPQPIAKKSSGGLKIVLISLAIIMVLGIASVIGGVYYVSKRASRAIAEFKPTVTDNPASVSDDQLGVPIYPNARREKTVSGSFGPMSGAVVIFSTKDDAEEVANFYREHFQGIEKSKFSEISEAGKEAVFQVSSEEGSRLITIAPNGKNSGRTEIVIILGSGVPGFPVPPPPPPPPPRGDAARKAQEIERRALEQAEKVLRDLETAPPPPPPAKR